MMRYIYLIILGLFFSVINMEANNSASISLVPCPTNVVPGTGSFQPQIRNYAPNMIQKRK